MESQKGVITGSTAYAYDAKGELSSAGATAFARSDWDGDLTTKGTTTQTFNADDELTSTTTGGATSFYDDDAIGDLYNILPCVGTRHQLQL